MIEKSGDPSGLSRSLTCFSHLDLPPCRDHAVLERKLLPTIELVFPLCSPYGEL